ncbi:2-hydroxyacyl-CoA dehydratase subunit D [Desulfomonile tiedjei]|uniref:Benzoyl-CoA reductase/2-hydroxyglutaryl-CoA dehydratase subunit, BcrC/BadD/HgdB n=1 Tax=Desulfomonile tiedjei (strain ATCC 49306 / DSM 6799 / DCB-1) TaxID=706587 RepID=I4C3U6_DESTA|nr:2-hydroxyacyl-CoA dehydratase family protein [Desulfomonile tiedjei]AFM24237.1 Benzoyl-CoA reductase/2-hydroxyglutaryl-CoA dehydratase subunit, BcrC/BadD/HgdB [Desulfomonile tiedjei DSM 6799]
MSVQDPWTIFREMMQSPAAKAGEWKSAVHGRVIGHLLPDVPEEILHASGALPVAIEGAGIHISQAQAHIPGYTCSHAMGALEMGLAEELDVLDGMVIPYVCDTTRNLFHIWDTCFPQMNNEFLRLPKRIDLAAARDYLHAEFSRLFAWACSLTGRTADLSALEASIRLYNQSRSKLRAAYKKYHAQSPEWTAERINLLVASAMRTPREEHLKWMEALPWENDGQSAAKEITRVYVRGKVWDPPGILNLMDNLGLIVTSDEIVTGFRGIQIDAHEEGDPLKALVNRHFAMPPYAGYHTDPAKAANNFVRRVKDSGAQGAIFLNPKFCEAAGFDTPDFQKALTAKNIPSLILETSARGVSIDQVRLRLEAFREMLAEDLP